MSRPARYQARQEGTRSTRSRSPTGATYVGSTGGRVLDRLEQHFGADQGQPAPSITVAAVRGLGTFAIVSRAVAGIAWRVVVLASGLSEQRARDRARVWRGSLDKPIQ